MMALTPEYLESLPDALVELYAQAEADILADMARRISTYDYWIPAAEHQAKKLEEMGMVREKITKRMVSQSGKTQKELRELMQDAGTVALRSDDEVYKRAGLTPPPLRASKPLQKVLNAGLKQTQGTFRNLTQTTANTATGQFERALDRAWLQISSGAFDQRTATRMAIKDLAKRGVGAIRYPSGHIDTIEVAVTRAVRTGVNQTCQKLQLARADEMGCDLVEVTAHGGARPSHAAWQGHVYSRSGQHPKYPEFESSTGYGTGAGLGGWNCRHSFYPYFEGMLRAYSKQQLEEYETKRYEYNGRKLTEYEATQHQRYIERQIRRWKREQQAMQAAGLSAEEAAEKVAGWQAAQREFIRQTGLKRRYDREQIAKVVMPKATAQFGARGVPFNKNATFKVDIDAFSPEVNAGLSKACLEVAKQGSLDGKEHEILVDLLTGKHVFAETGDMNSVGELFYKYLDEHPGEKFAFVHNHSDGRSFSLRDMETFFGEERLGAMIASGHNGKIYIAYGEKHPFNFYDEIAKVEDDLLKDLRQALKEDKIYIFEYAVEKELREAQYIAKTFAEFKEVEP